MNLKKLLVTLVLVFGGLQYSFASTRWIVYTATQSINCSSYLNGGKLTTNGTDTFCSDDAGGDTSSFLSLSSATATYLMKSSATATYLTKSSATATYFSPANPTTSNIPEGSNLYFTTARSTSAVSASAPLTYANGVFGVDSSSVTLLGQSIPAAKIASGSLGSSVIASSVAVNSVYPGAVSANTYSNITLPAANVAAGSLGTSVIASSIAVSAVQDASIVGVSASKLTGTATLPNATVDGSSVTKQGNTFNGASQLVQLNGSTQLPAVSGANLTSLTAANISAGSLGSSVIASSIAVSAVQDASIVGVGGAKITGTATIPNAAIDGSSVTKRGQNIGVLASTQTWTGTNTFGAITSSSATVNGGISILANGSYALVVSTSGIITRPLQPCFYAHRTTNDTSATGNGTNSGVGLTSVYDVGSNFASNTYTAPVTGKYHLSGQVTVGNISTAMTSAEFRIVTTARTFLYQQTLNNAATSTACFHMDVLASMTAGDTTYLQIKVSGAGANTANILGSAEEQTYFSGNLEN